MDKTLLIFFFRSSMACPQTLVHPHHVSFTIGYKHEDDGVELVFVQTQRLQRELRAEHELTQRELQESSRRLQRECDHRVALEKEKVQLMEEERVRLLQQVLIRLSVWASDPVLPDETSVMFVRLQTESLDSNSWRKSFSSSGSSRTSGPSLGCSRRTTCSPWRRWVPPKPSCYRTSGTAAVQLLLQENTCQSEFVVVL